MTDDSPDATSSPNRTSVAAPVLDAVADAVSRLRYGIVQLTIHEGKVVQLDVTDRLRFR